MESFVTWNELGSPKKAGEVAVPNLGIAEVSADDLRIASQFSGKVAFELIDVSAGADPMSRYRLGAAIPLGDRGAPNLSGEVTWDDLGAPSQPGRVLVDGVGYVEVTSKDIQVAQQYNGRIRFRLIDVTGGRDKVKHYRLGEAIPL